MNKKTWQVRKGEIYYAELTGTVGSEQSGIRPALIVQNDVGNKHSPTTIIASLTSQTDKPTLPTHLKLDWHFGLQKDSIVMMEQIRTIDKSRLLNYIGKLDDSTVELVDDCLRISFGIGGDC